MTTYFDNDRTGDYDPGQEAQRAKNARSKASMKRREKSLKKEETRKVQARAKGHLDRDPIEKCIAVLRFQNYGNVRNIIDDEDNWPPGHSEIDSDWELEVQQNRNYYRSNTPGVQQLAVDDPYGELDDLTGHPEARGCGECRGSEKDCSMVKGGTFPCDQCLDGGLDCRTILRPTQKGACECCLEDGEECSIKDDPNQASCDNCSFLQHVCVLVALDGYRTPRIPLDEILYGPNRKHVQCTVCRREEKRCSLKKKTDKPPCRYCNKNGLGCTFEDLPKIIVEKKPASRKKVVDNVGGDAPEVSRPTASLFTAQDLADMYREDTRESVREATPDIEMEDEYGNKGMLTKIRTSFANPIRFYIEVDQASDCNFCAMPMFGIVGYFEREVHVIRWYSGLGHTEVGGGHCAEKGEGSTVMCIGCTNTRLQVICCPRHTYERLFDAVELPDFCTLGDDLMNAPPGSENMKYEQLRWCSLCFTPASIGCSTIQASLAGGEDEEVVGCGLRLCEGCFEALQGNFVGDFDLLAEAMASQPKTSEDDEATDELQGKPRADVDFISHEGLLMRCVNAGCEAQ